RPPGRPRQPGPGGGQRAPGRPGRGGDPAAGAGRSRRPPTARPAGAARRGRPGRGHRRHPGRGHPRGRPRAGPAAGHLRLPAVRAGAGAAVAGGHLRRPGRGGAGGVSMLVVARWTVLEARRRRLLLAGGVLSVAFVALFAVGFTLLYHTQERSLLSAQAQGIGPAGDLDAREELLAMSTILVVLGLYGVQFLAALLGLFLGVASVSPEIDSGALHAVLARPLTRLDYLLGRFLALAGLLSAYVLVMSGALLLTARVVAGYQPGDVTRVVGMMILEVLILLAVSLLGSTVLPTLANGVVMLALFGLAWLGGI